MPAAQRKHSSVDVMRGQNSAKSYAFVFAKLNALFKKADGHGVSGNSTRIKCTLWFLRIFFLLFALAFDEMTTFSTGFILQS